jgi:DNA replication and repair protein RecF
MKLKKLTVSSFRNLKDSSFVPGQRFNIIFGKNAQGKTNLLEAIYLLGTMKSFRMAKNAEMLQWGSSLCSVTGEVERDGITREIQLAVEKNGKRARVDRKHVAKLSDFFGSLNVVVFSPEDISMVRGMPDVRRKYLDRAIFSGDLTYLHHHHEFFKTLKHRNMLLKSGDLDGLDIWSEKLIENGAKLVASRLQFLRDIQGLLREFYGKIAGNGAEAGISYRPHLMDINALQRDGRSAIAAALDRAFSEEQRIRTTVVGPHRDDVDFLLGGKVLKHHASQGEQRSFVLALKMAEIEYIQRVHGDPPVLLLDDMTSELDRERNRNLMEFLAIKEMQVFITTTAKDNVLLNERTDQRIFQMESGRLISQR